jgi:ABC-type transporter Mla subunit MlaD
MPRRKAPAEPDSGAGPAPPADKPKRSRTSTASAAKPALPRSPAARPRAPRAPVAPKPAERLEQVAARFEAACESLARSLHEIPRPDDFQPLADHLYAFASAAPALVESLGEVPRAAGPIQEAVRGLEQLAETLHFAHERFNESLLRLPRAEDYEPLAAPLSEFARVSPALAESLAEVLRVARPLGAAVQQIEGVSRALHATEERLARALTEAPEAPAPEVAPPADARLSTAAETMRVARDAILEALRTLPREPAYATLAGQLRELATVSPSLMDWLRQTPTLVAPLTASVASLQAAALCLEQGLAALGVDPPEPGPSG